MIEKNVRDIIGCPLRENLTTGLSVAIAIDGTAIATATTAIAVIVN